jgi:crotonobetainyl-CoA:carnitine CoA-transferase CaiB-like acyl-CoA transferase
MTNPDYATGPARSKNCDALSPEINTPTQKKTTNARVNELNAARLPCGPIHSIDQMFAHAQIKHLGITQDVPNDQNRNIRLVGRPFTLSRTPSNMAARPPEVSEQTEELLAEFGFSTDKIASLRVGKAF